MAHQIVVGQFVRDEKADAARRMRRDMTPAERTLWDALRGRHLGAKFRRQQVIDGFIADFYCHEAALVIETDGPVHDHQRGYDAERDRILAARCLRVVRVTNREVSENLAGVLRRIKGHLTPPAPLSEAERGEHDGVSFDEPSARWFGWASGDGKRVQHLTTKLFDDPASPPLRFGEGVGG